MHACTAYIPHTYIYMYTSPHTCSHAHIFLRALIKKMRRKKKCISEGKNKKQTK